MDAAIPADAQNAPTGIWKSRTEREIPTAPTPIIVVVNERKNNGDSNSVAKPSTESDQAHIAVGITEGTDEDVWIGDVERGGLTPMTPGQESEIPLWTPGGADIVYAGVREGQRLTLKQSANGGAEEVLDLGNHFHQHLSDISNDGTLVWTDLRVANAERYSLWTSELDEAGATRRFLPSAVGPQTASFSPDGRWLVYQSYESARPEIYAVSFPDGGGRIPISRGPGTEPTWSRDGREIFYRNGEQMMVVAVDTTDSLEAALPDLLFENNTLEVPAGAASRQYDVTADGRRFLMVKPLDPTSDGVPGSTPQINVVQNWFEELRRLVPTD